MSRIIKLLDLLQDKRVIKPKENLLKQNHELTVTGPYTSTRVD